MSVPKLANFSYTDVVKSNILSITTEILKASFGTTLNKVPMMPQIMMALFYRESSFDYNSISPSNGWTDPKKFGYAYMRYSAISAVYNNPGTTATQKANIELGVSGIGLGQVLGMYFLQGASQTGAAPLMTMRPDLAGPLILTPGSDIVAAVCGEANARKAILASLIVLESKYKSVKNFSGNYGIVPTQLFANPIGAAVAGYLGLGTSDINGATPAGYAAEIVGGSIYQVANSSSLNLKQYAVTGTAGGPSTNGTGISPLKVPGC